MAILGVDDFKAKLAGGGARPNLFKITLGFPGYAGGDVELTSFMCRTGQLPGSTVPAVPVAFRGRQLQIAGDRTFEPWSVTIINDTNFTVRDSMERWMNGINAHSQNTGLTTPIAYEADLKVDQLDRDGSTLKTYTFRGAYPQDLSEIALSYGDNDNIERFTCVWAYQYFESNTTS